MSLKDWKKLGEDRYRLKDGVGEVWVEPESRTVRLKATAVHGANAHRWGTVYTYIFYHQYLGDGGHPDPKIFNIKSEAHAHLMKHVKTKDY